MSIQTSRPIALTLFLFYFLLPTFSFAQGPLTPSGTPGPTMKSLDQVEARTPISAAPFTISSSGSYYLTKNLSVASGNAISINASGVTLDLNGFTISSTAASANGTAISIASALQDIAILNGFIKSGVTESGGGFSGSGFINGIEYFGSATLGVLISHIIVSGVQGDGIYFNSDSASVESCVVRTAGGDGIIARTIRGCTAVDCGSYAINGASVSDSYGSSVGGIGISASEASNCHAATASSQSALDATIAINCFASNAGSGTALNAGTAQNCYGSATTGTGISIFFGVAQNCYGTATTGTGIHANIAMNCTGYNHGGGSGGRGLSVSTIAIGCYGECSGAGNIGLEAPIANSCFGLATNSGVGESITYRYNMP